MARRKKSSKQKRKTASVIEPKAQSFLWRQIVSVVFIILALFILLGGFDWGGALPIQLFKSTAWCLGLAAYLLPFVLLYWAIAKLKDERHKLPKRIIVSSIFFLFCLSGMLHVFVDRETSLEAAAQGTYGGEIGHYFSGFLISFLSNMTAFVTFLILTWLAFMVMFAIAPKSMLSALAKLFGRKNKDTNLGDLKAKEVDFEVRAGVPIVHHDKAKDEKSAAE